MNTLYLVDDIASFHHHLRQRVYNFSSSPEVSSPIRDAILFGLYNKKAFYGVTVRLNDVNPCLLANMDYIIVYKHLKDPKEIEKLFALCGRSQFANLYEFKKFLKNKPAGKMIKIDRHEPLYGYKASYHNYFY